MSIKSLFLAFAPNDLDIFISRLLKTTKSFQMMQTKRREGSRETEGKQDWTDWHFFKFFIVYSGENHTQGREFR